MIDARFKEAIKIIFGRLEKNNIEWALIGSTNMSLQGMDVKPRDLDIVVKLKDLSKIKDIFSKYNASAVRELPPMTNEPAWEVKLDMGGVEVQVLGEKNSGEYVSKLLANKLTHVKINNLAIPCFTLEAEAQTYAETNREHKANLIKEFLKRAVS